MQPSCGEEFEILCRRALDRLKRDRGVESGQPALVRYRKREQIHVGKLAMALNVIPAEPSGVAYAYRVRPEKMLTTRAEGLQTRGCILRRRAPARIGRIGQYADQPVLCERTSRPSAAAIASEPGVRRLVMQVGGIEQRNQDIYVEQGDHAPPLQGSSRSRLTISGVTSRVPRCLGRIGTPLRLRRERSRGASALRASSERIRPAVVLRLAASSLALSRTSSSISSVVRTWLSSRINHQMSKRPAVLRASPVP